MQKVEGKTIKLNRGDALDIKLGIKLSDGTNYTFQVGDTIIFSVYEVGKLNENAIIKKTITVASESTTIDIELASYETKIGEIENFPVDYWYEIELNSQYTIIGYDDEGAKIFRLFPEGSQLTE